MEGEAEVIELEDRKALIELDTQPAPIGPLTFAELVAIELAIREWRQYR